MDQFVATGVERAIRSIAVPVQIKNHGLGQYGAEPHYSVTILATLCIKGLIKHDVLHTVEGKCHTDLLEHHAEFVELGDDSFPVDTSWTYDVIQLEDDVSIAEVAV